MIDNTVILGSRGLLGSHVCQEFKLRGKAYLPLRHGDLDITDTQLSRSMLDKNSPSCVINCAAFCSFQGCEDNPELSQQVNYDAPCWWAEECARRGIKLVHFSSDYIFDGSSQTPYSEDSKPAPESVYARHKTGCETFFQQFPGHLLLRVSWLFGSEGKTFLSMMPKLLMENNELTVASGKRGTCLHVGYAAKVIYQLLEADQSGLFNLAHTGEMSWEKYAATCLNELNERSLQPTCQIIKEVPYRSLFSTLKAKRPEYSALDTSKLSRALDQEIMPWQEGLKNYLDLLFPASATLKSA